jgi:hypothetical protein
LAVGERRPRRAGRDSQPQQTNPITLLLWVRYDFPIHVARLDLVPKLRHSAAPLRPVPGDVVKRHQTAPLDERRVQLKIVPHAFVRVISVDK